MSSSLEQTMMDRITSGTRLESAGEMTPEYRENLVHLLTMQADSELAGGYGYVPWITKAPTVEEKHVVAQIVKDELRHATVMYGLLGDLGFDVETHVRKHDEIFTMRSEEHTSELQSHSDLVCRLLLEKKKKQKKQQTQ